MKTRDSIQESKELVEGEGGGIVEKKKDKNVNRKQENALREKQKLIIRHIHLNTRSKLNIKTNNSKRH